MSWEDRGPAYILSLLAGALILLGGVFRAASSGMLPNRVYGTGYRLVLRTFPNVSLLPGATFLQVSAVIGIVSGTIVLTSAVMLSTRVDQNAIWGTLTMLLSVVGLLGGGGFLIGSLLGIVAGILAIIWKPLPRSVQGSATN